MSSNVTDLRQERESREIRDALAKLDEAAAADGIDPESYLGRYHAAARLLIEQSFAAMSAHQERILETAEECRAFVERCEGVATAELAKLDRAARVQEAQFKRQELDLSKSVNATVERLALKLGEKLRESQVIRSNAYNRRLRVNDWIRGSVVGGIAVILILIAGIAIDRTLLYHAPTYADADLTQG